MIVDRKIGIPVMYDIYPGSIVDVNTLKNTIKKVEYCGVHEFVLILDRGFFSTPNITELLANRISFIIPLPSRIKEAKRILSSIHAKINDPNRMQMYNNELIFVMPVKVEIGGNTLNAYAFYNPDREKEEKDAFYKRLYAVVETLKGVKLTKWMDAKDVVEEIAGELQQYIEWSEKGERIGARIRAKAVAQRVNRMGKVILLYNGDFTWQEVLSMYRGKDIVEKSFEMLKHDIAALPMNAHKTETVKGFLFLCFLSLILRMRLLKQMQDTGLCEKYTVDALLLELEKIKKVELSNNEMLVTELTKKQKDILARLGLESFA
jgi:transposase